VDILSHSLGALLVAPGQQVSVTTAQVQMMLQIMDPSLPLSGMSMPGGVAAAALPPGTLTGAAMPLVAALTALAFDPNLNQSAANTSGVVSLSLSGMQVANLTSLITLTLPSARLSRSLIASPVFWDSKLNAYSSAGLVALPNPAPPLANLTIAWVPGFNATSDDLLPLAWNVSGPSALGCTHAALNCGDGLQRTLTVTACPGDSRSPSWGCGGATSGVLRGWTGCTCALWLPPPNGDAVAAAAWCGWNVSTQTFAGAGCLVNNVTQVATRHLTAFTVQAAPPEIKTLSASDLVSISPQDLVHIKGLLIIVCVLFTGMHVSSALLARMDRRDFARLNALALSPQMGHLPVQLPNGVQLNTWRLTQEPLASDKTGQSLVSGPAVVFAGLVGIPFARLAFALPSSMLGGEPVKHCIGRSEGLCPSRIERQRSERMSMKDDCAPAEPRILSLIDYLDSPHVVGAGSKAIDDELCPPPPVDASVEHADECFGCTDLLLFDLCTVASTALMHATLASWCMAGTDELVAQQRLFLTHAFRGHADAEARCHQFLRLYVVFKEMLIGGTMRSSANWMPTARLWRMILLAEDTGWWAPSDDIAFALLANNQVTLSSRLQGFQQIASLFSGIGSLIIGDAVSGTSASTGQLATTLAVFSANVRRVIRGRSRKPVAGSGETNVTGSNSKDREQSRGSTWDFDGDSTAYTLEDGDDSGEASGCTDPLTFEARAILETTPSELAAALLERGDSDGALAARVWTTALVAAFLDDFPLRSWRVSPKEIPLEEQRTLLDAALAWLAESVVDDGQLTHLMIRARAQVLRWTKLHDRRVTVSRAAHIATAEHVSMRCYGAAAQVYSKLVSGHPTVSLFASEISIGFTRWMGMNLLVSAIMTMLVRISRPFACRLTYLVRLAAACLILTRIPRRL
jgi:hypothetical protein